MELYEYLIGGKKTGQIDDLKDPIPDSNPFCELKEGDTFFVSKFISNGTRICADEIKISSIRDKSTYWVFTGFAKKGVKHIHLVWMKDLNKNFYVYDQHTYYEVFSTFEMDGKPLFELVKKEIKNSKK